MRIETARRLCVLVLSILFVVSNPTVATATSSGDSENTGFTLTTEVDFTDAETKWNVDTTSDPGNVRMEPSPFDWIKGETTPVMGEQRTPGTVMHEDDGYKMWYSYDVFGQNKMGFASSIDGLIWSDHPHKPLLVYGTWDSYHLFSPSVVWNGSTYHMVYAGHDGGAIEGRAIGHAVSSDGIHWTKDPSTPVFSVDQPGSWDDASVSTPSLLWENGTFKMWYAGYDGGNWRIGLATSRDGITWTRSQANPVLNVGPLGAWDATHVSHPSVFKWKGTYYMLYVNAWETTYGSSVGIATSQDGENWTKYQNNPILFPGTAGEWDQAAIVRAVVSVHRGSLRLWYAGWDGQSIRIGYATASYGSRFVKQPSNPVLDLGPVGAFDSDGVGYSDVMFEDGKYRMWYVGGFPGLLNTEIGYAESLDGFTWSKLRSNPVVRRDTPWDSGEASGPRVLRDSDYFGGNYRMWYSAWPGGVGDGPWRIAYAFSADGINWTKPSTNPINLTFGPEDHQGGPFVLKDGPNSYKMWYDCRIGAWQICYATSTDGFNWTKSPFNPVVSVVASSWESIATGVSWVLNESGTYKMWYMGWDGSNGRIGYAESSDGETWVKYPLNPIMYEGVPGSWDSSRLDHVAVLKEGERYRMWYTGGPSGAGKIGHAVSLDGINWTKRAVNPVLGIGFPNSWDQAEVTGSHVLKTNGGYMMWYRGRSDGVRQIGLAQSTDGIIWTKSLENPVIAQDPGKWDEFVGSPCVLYSGGLFEMWYMGQSSGGPWKIGYANSTDGIHWSKYSGNPVLEPGPPGSWDDYEVLHPYVIKDEVSGIYKMWYSGDNDNIHYKIGYAESVDGLEWTKSSSNPVLVGAPGTWEENLVAQPSVIEENNVYKMWYMGQDSSNMERIGFAVSFDGRTWTKSLINPVLNHSPSGIWDSRKVAHPSVMWKDGEYAMWYSGRDIGPPYDWKIGTAVSEYTSTGTLVSQVIDSMGTTWKNVSWNALIPANSALGFSVRTGNTPTPDESWTDWGEDVYDRTAFDISTPNGRYLQYRATFVSMDGKHTPVLSEVRIGYYLNASFYFRIAGEKWHNVEVYLYEDGATIGYANIRRHPGSPNEQKVHLANVSVDYSKNYSMVAYYTPGDDPINGRKWGGTPAWLIIKYGDEEIWIHHTFNVRNERTWVWTEDLDPYFPRPTIWCGGGKVSYT